MFKNYEQESILKQLLIATTEIYMLNKIEVRVLQITKINKLTSVFHASVLLQSGVSIKAGYRRSTAACRTSYRRLFGFHLMKIKMILIKKKQIQQK